jgi:pimeloyl-ACP methyl ester carboxylesterase
MTRTALTLPTKQYLTIDGQRLGYLTAGDPTAPPLLMVHGWLLHAGMWRQTIDAFRDTHYCVAVDLLGLADSDKPAAGDYSIPAQAGRVLAVMDKLGIQQFALIGHSMGGQIALYIAAVLAPERVVKLVDVAGVSTGKLSDVVANTGLPRMRSAMGKPWLWTILELLARTKYFARGQFPTWFYDFDAIPFADWQSERQMALRSDINVTAVRCGEAILTCDLTDSLSHIDAPTLVIFGAEDAVVPLDEGRTVERLVAGGRMVVFERCGHFPMMEAQPRYLDTLRDFLTA